MKENLFIVKFEGESYHQAGHVKAEWWAAAQLVNAVQMLFSFYISFCIVNQTRKLEKGRVALSIDQYA